MSINIKNQNLDYVDDCRSLSYAECLGFIFHDAIFNNRLEIINLICNNNNLSYVLSCNPKSKSIEITFKSYNYKINYIFMPAFNRGIHVSCFNNNSPNVECYDFDLDIDSLEDFTL